jgi:hypothetical protein
MLWFFSPLKALLSHSDKGCCVSGLRGHHGVLDEALEGWKCDWVEG